MARITQQHIAEYVGVSGAAVSLALSGRDDASISVEMRERIARVAEEMGYIPRARARSHKATGGIGYVVPVLNQTNFLSSDTQPHQHLVHGSTMRLLESHGYHLLTVSSASLNSFDEIIDKVDGLIITADEDEERLTYLRSLLPSVVINYLPRQSQIDAVAVNDIGGIMMVMRHLYDLGHRRIALFGYMPCHFPIKQRIEGYRRALAELSLPIVEDYISLPYLTPHSNWLVQTMESAINCVRDWCNMHEPPTAIVALDDSMAFRVLRAAREIGMSVPDDISVAGYNDLEFCQISDPSLTTVLQPSAAVGEMGVKMLLERMTNPDDPAKQIVIAPRLIARESTKQVRTL